MSSRCVVTGHCGDEWGVMSQATSRTFHAYCGRHGIAFYRVELRRHSRPPPWMKLIAIAEMLAGHGEVLWVDADVAASDCEENIFDVVPNHYDAAMCRLTDQEGVEHFNSGVLLARRSFIPCLVEAAMMDDCIHHKWWEQEAINRLTTARVFSLPAEWNFWSGSIGVTAPKFRHACGVRSAKEKLQWLFP